MRIHPALSFTATVLATLTAALPGQAPRWPDPQLAKSVEPASAATFEAASESWQRFAQNAGGEWTTRWCAATGTPRAIFGTGLPIADWRENSLVEARRHALHLLEQQGELLGLGTSEFREVIGSRMGRTWCFVFDQFYRGLPVIDGRADVRVHMVGRVSMFGSTAWPIPADFVTVPQIDELTATRIAWQHLAQVPPAVAQPGGLRQPRLVIWGDVNRERLAPVHLAFEIPISAVDAGGQGPIGRYYIDARTAEVLTYVNDKHECGDPNCRRIGAHELLPLLNASPPASLPAAALPPSTGIVMAWTRVGTSATAALTNVPLAGVEVNVPGVGIVVTNSSGQFSANIASNVSVTVNLNGIHTQLIAGSSAPSVTQTLIAGGTTTFQFLSSAASANQAAHTSTYYWVDRINDWCRTLLGNTAELDVANNVLPNVNIASTCNAYYTGNTINFYQAGGGCNNTAYSSVVAHEWGHGLDERYGGISQTNGLSEGWGDTCSMYLLDNPIVGENFTTTGGFIRTGNNTRQYPTGSGVHAQGESFGGFAWKLRERLAVTLASRAAAIAVSNDIVISSIVADATNQPDAVLQIFIADDNDGNLSNGTPHSAELIHACNLHSLPYPGGGPTGPANDECGNAIAVGNGQNGPYTSVGALTSSPTWPCASGGADVWFRYVAGTAGTLAVDLCNLASWDTALEILAGTCGTLTSLGCNDDSCSLRSSVSVSVTPGTYYIRVGGYNAATGSFSLNVNGPTGSPATSTPYGAGCYRGSKAFYEFFGAPASFDLNGVRMRLVKTGDLYVAAAGGAYVAPTAGATALALADDGEATVALSGTFPYPGGTTASLVVCSNGFVSVASGNGTEFVPTSLAWLISTQPRWGCWHDHNPAAASSGAVKFQQVGSIAYVTWDGVFSFGTTTPNTWQLQFDLATGNVTYAWQTMSGLGNEILVGYAHTAPNDNLGSMDISTALPGTFRTSAQNLQPLALSSNLPQLGSTLTFTATNYPAASGLGIQVISFVVHDPGLDLTAAGMPGCRQFVGSGTNVIVLPSGGASTYSIVIPSSSAYIGLPINSQTYALSPGANALGLISSNGVRTRVGL